MREPKILLLNLPSPSGWNLLRDAAGGFGTAIPWCSTHGQGGETALHPFLPYASSVLFKAGYEFKAVDGQRLKLNESQVLHCVKREDPDIIVSIISLPSMKNDIRMLSKIKESSQSARILGVGTVCRVIPHEILLNGNVDVILRNSYPYVSNLVDLIRALDGPKQLKDVNGISYVENGQVVSTLESPDPGLGDLPAPCYNSVQLDGYETFMDTTGECLTYVPVLESRGCPYNCVYCPYPLGFGRKWTFRSTKALVDEIEYLNAVRNIRGFLLRGQTFAYNRKRAIQVCEEIIRRQLNIAWFCESRVDEIDKELLEKMKRAGCEQIHFGVETGNPENLIIAKPGVKLHSIGKAFALAKKIGMHRLAHVILGWPDDNQKRLENTRRFIRDLSPDAINVNFLTPYPGTQMYEAALKEGLLIEDDWSNYTSHTVVMRTKNLSSSQLYAMRNRIYRDLARARTMRRLKKSIANFNARRARAMIKPSLFANEIKSLVSNILLPERA